MPTDDERREAARRLRELGKLCYAPGNTYELMIDALGVDDFEGTDELFTRLADLIEPAPSCEFWDAEEQECYSVARTVRPVDRDALLALADKLEQETGSVCGVCMGNTARRIREACGATQDD